MNSTLQYKLTTNELKLLSKDATCWARSAPRLVWLRAQWCRISRKWAERKQKPSRCSLLWSPERWSWWSCWRSSRVWRSKAGAAGTFIDRGRVQAPAGLPSISSPSTTKHHLLHLDRVRGAVAKMEETLDEQMEIIIRELSPVDEEETGEEPVQAEKVFDDDLWKLQSQYVINVTLDPNREPPSLILSEDRRQVRDGGWRGESPTNHWGLISIFMFSETRGFLPACSKTKFC